MIAKAMDMFIGQLYAKSAFDKVIRQCAVKNAYFAGSDTNGLLYIDSRLSNRKTFVEWDQTLMGPICDVIGLEQGGVNSDGLYKLYNNIQLSTGQLFQLGVPKVRLLSQVLAKQTTLHWCLTAPSNSWVFSTLQLNIVRNTMLNWSQKKTNFNPPKNNLYLTKLLNPLSLHNHKIAFSNSADHVRILRSVDGNLPNVMARLSAHNKVLMAVFPAGMAYHHHKIEGLFGTPVMLSGLSALVLSKSEISVLAHHHKLHL